MVFFTTSHIHCAAFLGALVWFSVTMINAEDKASTVRPPWTKSRIAGSPETPAPYRIVSAYPQVRFEKPTSIEEIPGANRLLITEIGGRIYSLAKIADAKQADLVGDLRELLPNDLAGRNVSLFDAELHPRFRENRNMFVCYVHPGQGGHTRVSRFTLGGDSKPSIVPKSEEVIITWPSGGHNGGCLEFGRDGNLYISTGDGSGPNPPDGLTSGQDVSDLLGAILRIDVDHKSRDRAYTVPSDNPFMDLKGARPEIWAYGLRNPWKFGVDVRSGDILAADNGWESWEMVHRIVRGGNCGWPVMEGRAALRTEVKVGPTPILPPVKDHSHTEANSVIGGPIYRGDKLPGLAGSFVYGDYITGTIWAIRSDENNSYSHTTLVETDQRVIAFTEGSEGELFVLDYDVTGQIYELLPSGLKDTSAEFPRRLSETGLFSSLETMEPAPGVLPYEVRVSRWMDGAEAQRWVAIPGDGQIQLSANVDQPATFPEGTVFVKHLTLPQGEARKSIRLETQVLHYESGVWQPHSYLWDESGEDAVLVASIGTQRPLRVGDSAVKVGGAERTWHVNASTECKLCHNAGPRFVLGFVPHQLNLSISKRSSDNISQLTDLAAQGVLRKTPTVASDDPSRLVDPHDDAEDLDARARSYLHANCGMCHHPGGNAIVSFYLRRDLPFAQLNTNKGTGIGTFGMRNAKIIASGDPYRSVLMYRMSKLGYARMPYIGSRVVDSAGVALIEQWIRSLPSDEHALDSSPLKADSAEAKALRTLSADQPRLPAEEAVRELVKSTEGSLALIAEMHRGRLKEQDLQAVVSIGRAVATADIRGLFENFVPESQRRATLGSNINPEIVLNLKGNLERGKLIFFSDNARCRACHEVDDSNKSVGPTLQEINKKFPKPSELLQHVFQPSLKIDDAFAAYSLVTDDGRAINGLLAKQTDDEIVIKTAEKQIVRFPRNRIEELRKSDKSLMPEQILSDLTAQEAADLFEFLRSLGSSK